jgi:hypothetical protein
MKIFKCMIPNRYEMTYGGNVPISQMSDCQHELIELWLSWVSVIWTNQVVELACVVQHVSLAMNVQVRCAELVDRRCRRPNKEFVHNGLKAVKNRYERLGPKDPRGQGRTIAARIGHIKEQEYTSDENDVDQSED